VIATEDEEYRRPRIITEYHGIIYCHHTRVYSEAIFYVIEKGIFRELDYHPTGTAGGAVWGVDEASFGTPDWGGFGRYCGVLSSSTVW
jgi:hypothetical protein